MSNTTDRPDLDALGKLCDAATPGPWSNGHDPSHFDTSEVSDNKTFAYYVPDENNARFIAAARTALPALIAYARRVEGERDALARHHAEFMNAVADKLLCPPGVEATIIASAKLRVVERENLHKRVALLTDERDRALQLTHLSPEGRAAYDNLRDKFFGEHGAKLDALRAELTAERDAHHATCDALARGRAECERLRGLVERTCTALDDAEWGKAARRCREELNNVR